MSLLVLERKDPYIKFSTHLDEVKISLPLDSVAQREQNPLGGWQST